MSRSLQRPGTAGIGEATDSLRLLRTPRRRSSFVVISAQDGKITLRGTVVSLREKREAKKAAQRVFGVVSVDDQLQVFVRGSVDATVDDAFVTLIGTADRRYQHRARALA